MVIKSVIQGILPVFLIFFSVDVDFLEKLLTGESLNPSFPGESPQWLVAMVEQA